MSLARLFKTLPAFIGASCAWAGTVAVGRGACQSRMVGAARRQPAAAAAHGRAASQQHINGCPLPHAAGCATTRGNSGAGVQLRPVSSISLRCTSTCLRGVPSVLRFPYAPQTSAPAFSHVTAGLTMCHPNAGLLLGLAALTNMSLQMAVIGLFQPPRPQGAASIDSGLRAIT